MCTKLVLNGSKSATCNSLNYVCHKYGLDKYVITTCKFHDIKASVYNSVSQSPNVNIDASLIRDLILIRENIHMYDFTQQEIDEMLLHLCTADVSDNS